MGDAPLPDGFRFGVATSGFQIEGGYNGRGQPANNWWGWERAGRAEPSGQALEFWTRYEHHLDRAVAAGCDAFRLSVEWARCEPAAGEIDGSAFDGYRAILDACHDRGLRPVVALHHFTHPRWLGENFWLDLDSPERFSAWAAEAVGQLSSRCRHWITMNEMNAYAVQSYITGAMPPGRYLDNAGLVRALDHMLAAHVLSYRAIHACQPDAVVSTNNHASTLYELDRLLTDVQLAADHGIGRADLRPWLNERRAAWYASMAKPTGREQAVRRAATAIVPLDQALPRAVAAAFGGPRQRTLDVLLIDYYNPVAADRLRLPGHRTVGGRSWRPFRRLWDDPVNPSGLTAWCLANQERGVDMEIAENGLCNRVASGQAFPRRDGWDRVRYLRANLAAVVEAIDAGAAVKGYYHWTLADNYEWGSYEPRFGLYGVDRRSGVRWSDLDSFAGDAAGAYRRLSDGLRAGDRSVIR